MMVFAAKYYLLSAPHMYSPMKSQVWTDTDGTEDRHLSIFSVLPPAPATFFFCLINPDEIHQQVTVASAAQSLSS